MAVHTVVTGISFAHNRLVNPLACLRGDGTASHQQWSPQATERTHSTCPFLVQALRKDREAALKEARINKVPYVREVMLTPGESSGIQVISLVLQPCPVFFKKRVSVWGSKCNVLAF